MYARIARIPIHPGTPRDVVLGEEYAAVPGLATLEGYRGMSVYADEDSGMFIAVTRWETREQAETLKSACKGDETPIDRLKPLMRGTITVDIVEMLFDD